MQERFYSSGMNVGVGVNLLTGEALVKAITGEIITPQASGQDVESRIVRIDDMSSLHKSLGIDVSASGSYMGFSASAKVDYADSCNFNEHSIYLLVKVTVTNTLTRIDSPALIPEAFELLQNQKWSRFRERFGDVYVAGVHTGGEYYAIYQVTGTDDSEKESLATTVSAAFSTIGASAELNVAIQKAKEQSHSHLDVRVFTHQLGGADTTQDQGPGQIMAKAHNFAPSLSGDNAKFALPFSILPEAYTTLNLPGDDANLIDIQNQKEMLARNFVTRNQVMLLINNIDYILLSLSQGHNEFEPCDLTELSAERNRLAGELDRIIQEASACMRDAKTCHLASFEAPTKPLPKKIAGKRTFVPALDRDWRNGNASTVLGIQVGANNFISRGRMQKLDLPHLFRITRFTASVQIGPTVGGFSAMSISLRRMPVEVTAPLDLMVTPGEVVIADLPFDFAPGVHILGGVPLPDFEVIDTRRFQYFLNAEFSLRNPGPTALTVPAGYVTWQSFEFDVTAA
jgi:hypothetical protein